MFELALQSVFTQDILLMVVALFSLSLPPLHKPRHWKAGVAFAKGYRVDRLWGIDEEGSFPTLERSLQGSSLKKTFPRTFGPADPHFTDARGVVLSNTQGEKVRAQHNVGVRAWNPTRE